MMRLKEFFKKAIETGILNDPRGADFVGRDLQSRKKDYEGLKDKDKEFFDLESLENPYADSRILNSPDDAEIGSVMVGIDIDTAEIILADTLRKKNGKPDLVIGHHPSGRAYAALADVMYMQSDILNRYGVPINVAEGLMDGRASEVRRRIMPVNHQKSVDAARILGVPFICLHTPADNMVATHLQRLFEEKKPFKVSDVMDMLMEIPEYRTGRKEGAGPVVLTGNEKRKAGKVFVDMTGGTEGAKEIFKTLSLSGINTVVGMHFSEDHKKEAEENHLNLVIAGHIASDNLGLNLLLDGIEVSSGKLEVIECSGFRRAGRQAGN